MATNRVSIVRLALTGALSLLVLYVACWLAALFLPIPVTHMFIGLFTSLPLVSLAALCVGGFWAFAWGGFAGALIAIFYNWLAFTDGKTLEPDAQA